MPVASATVTIDKSSQPLQTKNSATLHSNSDISNEKKSVSLKEKNVTVKQSTAKAASDETEQMIMKELWEEGKLSEIEYQEYLDGLNK